MKNIIILMSIVTFIFIIILIIQNLLEKRRLEIYKNNLLQDKDEKELKLMIGYNYISNLNKLDSIINEIIESNLDKEKLEYMENMIDQTYGCIYGNDIIKQTTYYENEYLYTTSILNLDIIFYAFKYVFKIIKKNNYHLYDNIDISWDAAFEYSQEMKFKTWPTDKKISIDVKDDAKASRDTVKNKIMKSIKEILVKEVLDARQKKNYKYSQINKKTKVTKNIITKMLIKLKRNIKI